MDTRTYTILVIDDEVQSRRTQYLTLAGDSALRFQFVESADQLSSIKSKQDIDGYLLDLNLDKWGLTAADVVLKYLNVAPRKRPTFLISAHLSRNDTTRALQAVRDTGSESHVDAFAWQDFADPQTGEIQENSEVGHVRQRMLRRLGDWYYQSEVAFGEDDLRILHLSDPQFGDPSLNRAMSFNEALISDALAERFGQDRRKDSSLVDIVVLSGDITYSGQKSEFDGARNWLEQALLPAIWPFKPLDESKERLVIVPGNHDANLRAISCRNLEFNFKWPADRTQPMLKPTDRVEHAYSDLLFQNYLTFLKSLDGEAARQLSERSSINWSVDRFLSVGVQFLLINTAFGIVAEEPDRAFVDESALTGMAANEGPDAARLETIRICVGHHPISSTEPKIRAIGNGPALVNFLRGRRVVAYLHGHSHDYDAQELIRGRCVAAMSPTSNVSVQNGRQGFNLVVVKRKRTKGVRPISSVVVETCEFHRGSKFNWLKEKHETKVKLS